MPEIGYRHSLALMSVRPLRTKLFSAYGIPQRLRSHLLRSLAVSRYSFGSAALPLQAASHKRLWSKHYVALWRCLWRRGKNEPYRHSYSVLGLAGAPPPPLALALARAVLLRQLTTTGPATLLQLLSVHWRVHPKSSWLGLLRDDVAHLAQYVSAARTLQATGDPVVHLIEAVRDDPRWWVRQVKQACRQAQKDLEAWCGGHTHVGHGTDRVPRLPASPALPDLPFQCHWCSAGFRLRKHLFAHMAKAHQIFSPARHSCHGSTCVSCLRCFHTVPRLQQHLKRTDRCLLRTCQLVPCLTIEEVRVVEGAASSAVRKIHRGQWEAYAAAQPVLQAFGPFPLTSRERLDLSDEDLDLGLVSRMFFPDPVFQAWVSEFVSERSTEGPRTSSSSFWDARPNCAMFHPNSVASTGRAARRL